MIKKNLKEFANFSNSLPFIGKIWVRKYVYNAVKENNPIHKSIRILEASTLLDIMIVGHLFQVYIGIDRFIENIQNTEENLQLYIISALLIDLFYAFFNFSATYAQVTVYIRLIENFLKSNSKNKYLQKEWNIDFENSDYLLIISKLIEASKSDNKENINTLLLIIPNNIRENLILEIQKLIKEDSSLYQTEELIKLLEYLYESKKISAKISLFCSAIKDAHDKNHEVKYSIDETFLMMLVTVAGNFVFFSFG